MIHLHIIEYVFLTLLCIRFMFQLLIFHFGSSSLIYICIIIYICIQEDFYFKEETVKPEQVR